MTELTDFTEDEISQVQEYIEANASHSLLSKTDLLTESPIEKTRIFVSVFRVLLSARNYSDKKLRKKLDSILSPVQDVYYRLYNLYSLYSVTSVNISNNDYINEMTMILTEKENIFSINKCIDVFIAFTEGVEISREE